MMPNAQFHPRLPGASALSNGAKWAGYPGNTRRYQDMNKLSKLSHLSSLFLIRGEDGTGTFFSSSKGGYR